MAVFYGLERRVLYDLLKTDFKNASVLQELDHIITEVEQLLDLYGDRQSAAGSFAHKAAMFLTICRALRSSNSPNNDPLADTICPTEASSLSLQIGLGQKIRQSQPIAADWALAWYTKIAKKQLRLVVTRCLDEFQTLFNIRYEQRFGKGIKLDAGQTSLRVEYLPTNHSFGRSLWLKFSHLADVNQCAGKLFQISEVVEACTIELEPLGRLLGRDPKAAKTPAAIALLPAVLLPTHGGKFAHNLQQWLTQTLSDAQTRLVTGAELLQYWSGANPEKLTKLEAIGLSKFLEQLGYGIEPDPRFGGALPTIQTKIALFRLSGQNPESLSSEYFETTLVAHLAIAIVNSDPALNSQKQHNLESRLTTFTTLKSSEQQRFYAHLKWLTQQKPALRNLKTRIDAVNPDRKPTIARFLAQIATADGQPHPKAIQPLEKAYSLLGLATQTVYSDLHDVATTALYEPITVRNAAPMRGHSLPSPDLALDMTLVQSKLEASQEIAHLLAEIFVDEDPSIVPQPAIPQPSEHKTSEHKTSDHKIPGLDAAHTAFLLTLAQQTTWTRPQLMTIATPLNLMLDGALELINELAFDRCNEPLIEGDNSLDVNAEVLQELLR
ncbi:MAG: hypothetical protein HC780_14125 [Leptolyngbyaceae cyanobacterium CSU_1_3]|nr:hypothetical protein [Leptolyngbyaceae cyanobacterium CSU_1_3]